MLFFFYFFWQLKVTFQGLFIHGCVERLSLTCFGIKTITLARFPLYKILEKPLGAKCCTLYFPFSQQCKHHYRNNQFCSDFGKCGNRCYFLFMDKVDCENKQRLDEFWELWMQKMASGGFVNVAFVWGCYFTAKDCRLDFAHVNMYIDCTSVTFLLEQKEFSKRMETMFKANLFNLNVLHRHFHFNTIQFNTSNFQKFLKFSEISPSPHAPSFQCVACVIIRHVQLYECSYPHCIYIFFILFSL